MINIFHVRDLHFGKSKTRTLKAQRLLRKIERFFHVTTEPNNDIIVTGDITNDGTPEQYKIALEAFLPFKGKIYFVPGNHDYGAIGFVYDEKRARYFDEHFAKELDPRQVFFEKIPFILPLTESDKNGVSLIGLNSCFKRPSKKRLAASLGMIGHRQLRAVEDFLKKSENKAAPEVLYLHHIPHEPAKDYWMDLLDWEELVDVAKGRVNLLAYGHSGRMPDPKDADLKAKVASAREMKVRTAQRDGFEYILDANDSVEDQSCYRITIENNALHRPVKEPLKK